MKHSTMKTDEFFYWHYKDVIEAQGEEITALAQDTNLNRQNPTSYSYRKHQKRRFTSLVGLVY